MELRQIEGHPDYYINDLGQFDPRHAVLSTKERINVKKLLHWQTPYMSGKHLTVRIDDTHIGIHVLLAKAFIPNPENKPIVHHKDFNPLNNCLDNLMFVTPEEHQLIHFKGKSMSEDTKRRISQAKKGKNLGRPKPKGAGSPPKPVERIGSNCEIKRYESLKDAERQTGICNRSISKCCSGKINYKTAGGYKWRYAD